ncbi:MAG: aspartate carbamoyltransferase regulatory subunit [Nitrososphaerota archaeon]|jgi:aspartate carbamoyltransferase regulatory subunit|nr:aspartate carbamoyltransferase regulatory subunit [Nitrososphaerota archaeon]
MSENELHVSKIKNGTVIDHICGGYALDVIRILGITGKEPRVMTLAVNVPSKHFGVKDIVKIEDKLLSPQEVNRIALVAPHASINLIRNYTVVEKREVQLPKVIEGIVKCINPSCVSNSGEPVLSKFQVKHNDPLLLKCHYCGVTIEPSDILNQL